MLLLATGSALGLWGCRAWRIWLLGVFVLIAGFRYRRYRVWGPAWHILLISTLQSVMSPTFV